MAPILQRVHGTVRTVAVVCLVIVAGAGGRRAAAAEDVPMRALRATVKLSDGQRGSTGFLVSVPNADGAQSRIALVTAAHALAQATGESCTVTFRAQGGEAGSGRRDLRVAIRAGEERLFVRHATADVAVIGVVPPADADFEPFARGDIADAARIEAGLVRAGRRTWVACYPAQVEGHPAGWPVLRHGSIASHPLLPVAAVPTFFIDYSHFGGDSGAAAVVDVDGTAIVAGVIVGMKRQTDRTVSPFEERTMHTPLDLAVTVHPLLVAETIDAWAKAGR